MADGAATGGSGAASGGRGALPPVVRMEDFPAAAAGIARQESLSAEVAAGERPLLLMWQAPRALIVGRSDTRLPGFTDACERLAAEGWPVHVRRSGGSACPVSEATLQIALTERAPAGTTIDAGYEHVAAMLQALLEPLGLDALPCEATTAFCPGRYDLTVDGRKIAGLSQHWQQKPDGMTVTTAASLIVEDCREEFVRIVDMFYAAAGSPSRCAPRSISSVREALGAAAPPADRLMNDLKCRLALLAVDGERKRPRRPADAAAEPARRAGS